MVMEYKGVSYSIRQMIARSGFSWEVEFPEAKPVRGTAGSRTLAENAAVRLIDKLLKAQPQSETRR
jgi:hypothetical protein